MPWLLDVVFAMAGRVRPYNKYLPWKPAPTRSTGGRPTTCSGWSSARCEGDVDAIRETFARVRPACSSYDAARGHTLTTDMVEGWGEELRLFEVRAG